MESLINYFLSTIRRERIATIELRENHEVLKAQYRDLQGRYSQLENRYSQLEKGMEEQKSLNIAIMRRLELLENK